MALLRRSLAEPRRPEWSPSCRPFNKKLCIEVAGRAGTAAIHDQGLTIRVALSNGGNSTHTIHLPAVHHVGVSGRVVFVSGSQGTLHFVCCGDTGPADARSLAAAIEERRTE